MIIVSQDRKKLEEVRSARIIECEGDYIVNCSISSYGVYKTEERAKEVLAEIIDAYHHCLDVYYMPKE